MRQTDSEYVIEESQAKRIFNILKSGHYGTFNNSKVRSIFNSKYNDKIDLKQASTVLYRLFTKNKLLRTKTQLKYGYVYSLKNLKELSTLSITY